MWEEEEGEVKSEERGKDRPKGFFETVKRLSPKKGRGGLGVEVEERGHDYDTCADSHCGTIDWEKEKGLSSAGQDHVEHQRKKNLLEKIWFMVIKLLATRCHPKTDHLLNVIHRDEHCVKK